MRNTNFLLMSAVSNNGNKESAHIDAQQVYGCSFVATFSDNAAAGTMKIQGSNDPCGFGNIAEDFTPTNWVDVASGSVVVAAGATSTVEKIHINYRWLRVTWTRTGGAGTFNVYWNQQGF